MEDRFYTPVTDRKRIAKKVALMERQGWRFSEIRYLDERTEMVIAAMPWRPRRQAVPFEVADLAPIAA